MHIALSAGHYPSNPGARYIEYVPHLVPHVAFVEHDEAVLWVAELAKLFASSGVAVTQIHSASLTRKIAQVNSLHDPVDLALEVHFNSAVNRHGQHVGQGSETLFSPGSVRGEELALVVQGELAKVFPPDRGAKAGWHRMDRPGVVDFAGDVDGDEVADAWLAKTLPWALIVEPEFVHNWRVIQDRRADGCEAIAKAVVDLLRR